MIDAKIKTFLNVTVDESAEIAWFDVLNWETVSVQIYAPVAWSGSPVMEIVVGNDRGVPTLLSTVLGVTASTLELSSSGSIITGIDVAGQAYRWIGARVKTAGTSGDRSNVYFVAKATGQGQTITDPIERERGF